MVAHPYPSFVGGLPPRLDPEPGSAALEQIGPVADARHLRRCAEHDGWPGHCPDPRCWGRDPRGHRMEDEGGTRCRGALRRLAPGRPRDYPTCYAFAIAAVIHEEDLTRYALLRAHAMLPMLLEGFDEERIGGPAPDFAGPPPGPRGARLAERLVRQAIAAAEESDAP